MKIQSLAQLKQHCQTERLAPIYLIHGDETLLVQASLDHLRKTAKKMGFEREGLFQITPSFDWTTLKKDLYTLSLFNQQRHMELTLNKPHIGAKGTQILKQYCQSPPTHTLLLLTANKLDHKTQQAGWVKAIDQSGVILPIYPLSLQKRLNWIKAGLSQAHLSTTDAVIDWIDRCTEGNLLATQQLVEKLKLFYHTPHNPQKRVLDLAALKPFLEDEGRFNLFELMNTLLLGHRAQCLRILYQLKAQGDPPTLILWGLTRQLRYLRELSLAQHHGLPLAPLFKQYRIFPSQQAAWHIALKRHSTQHWDKLFLQCSRIDQINKGAAEGDSWLGLSHVLTHIT